jgi:acylphosphatase/archaellum component FlaC
LKDIIALRLTIKGRVQRVGFRRYALDLAQDLGLGGYVKNLEDGSVELLVQGQKESVERFLEALKKPPPPISIREVIEAKLEPTPEIRAFKILYGEIEEELQEGFGAMQSILLDYWREFKDFRKEFQGYREEFKDFREEFRDFSQRTDENLRLLLEKYGEISEKLTIILEALVRESKETMEQLAMAVNKLSEAVEALKMASSDRSKG